MAAFGEAAYEALELTAALAVVATQASTDLGADWVRRLRPAENPADLEERRRRGTETARLLIEGALIPSGGDAFGPILDALTSEGGVGGRELLRVAQLLRGVEEARVRVLAASPPCAALAAILDAVPDGGPLSRRIEAVLDRRGEVREDATPGLVSLRRSIRTHRDRLYSDLSQHVGRLREHLAEDTIPLRNNRLVLMLDAGARGRVPGLVHGRSASGKSFYFEPLETVETNNQLQQSMEDEAEERRRVLAALHAEVIRALPVVEAHCAALRELDGSQAAARFARLAEGRWAEISTRRELKLLGARHPLLEPRLAEARLAALGSHGHQADVVPLDVTLDETRRVLVLTGPNAGGKTVALKTVGLLSLLHHCGLPIPCLAGTTLGWTSRFVATVGDDQDLLADRSTFSGRLLKLREAWDSASHDSLVLLDELGSGTDPEEGAALSVALLERLVEQRTLGLITTHLTKVAAAALDLAGAACGAMEFSPDGGRPTFRLVIGPPGGSEAIALARRLGLSPVWVARAEALLGHEQRDFRRLLAEVEAARDELGRARERFESEASDLAKIRERLDREHAALEAERRVTGARTKRDLDEFRLQTTRKLAGELERLRQEFQAGRRQRLAADSLERLFEGAPQVETEEEQVGSIVVGTVVRHRAMGWQGSVERVDGERVEVKVGGKRVKCKVGDLQGIVAPALAVRAPAARTAADAEEPSTPAELHLIGMRVEDALVAVDGFLDQALRGPRQDVRLVHGHGTGRLRDAVRQELRRHPAVASFRAGEPNEGGNGATVVALRDR